MNTLKIITAGFITVLTVNGCSSENFENVEGKNSFEIAACKLAKEFMISRETASGFDQMKCNFLDKPSFNDQEAIAIEVEPSEKNPKYDQYIEMKIKSGQETYGPVLYINPYNEGPFKNVLVYVKSSPPYEVFVKDNDKFRKPTPEELIQLKKTDGLTF